MIRWMQDSDPANDEPIAPGDEERVMEAAWFDDDARAAFVEAAAHGDVWLFVDPFAADVHDERSIMWAPTREAAEDRRGERADDI